MAYTTKGTRRIVVDGHVLRWHLLPPEPCDCPLCNSWRVQVLTERGQPVRLWETPVDRETGKPLPVTPGAVAAELRGHLDGLDTEPPRPRRQRVPHRQRH